MSLLYAVIALGTTALALYLPQPATAAMIGNCEVTGQKGAYSITPMIPGQLTVRANLPSRIGVYQGTTGADFVANVLRPAKQVSIYPNVPALIAAVTAGQIDTALDDTAGVLG